MNWRPQVLAIMVKTRWGMKHIIYTIQTNAIWPKILFSECRFRQNGVKLIIPIIRNPKHEYGIVIYNKEYIQRGFTQVLFSI